MASEFLCLKHAALVDDTLLCKMSQPHPTMVLHNNWRQSVFLQNTSSSSAPASSPHDFLEHVGQNCPCPSTLSTLSLFVNTKQWLSSPPPRPQRYRSELSGFSLPFVIVVKSSHFLVCKFKIITIALMAWLWSPSSWSPSSLSSHFRVFDSLIGSIDQTFVSARCQVPGQAKAKQATLPPKGKILLNSKSDNSEHLRKSSQTLRSP